MGNKVISLKITVAMILSLVWLLDPANSYANPTITTHDLRLSGGATSVFDTSTNAFSLPANNISLLRRDNFFIGNAFFQQPWVIAPASTKARDGLGPLFNTNACQSCHIKDGKGHPPLSKDEKFISTLVRLSIPADANNPAQQQQLQQNGVIPEPVYGDQLQPQGIKNLPGEATPRLDYSEIQGQFKDGEAYTLLQPKLLLDDLHYGPMHSQTQYSVRVAPAMIGLGLLEAISEADILANADPEDKDANGISGRPNHVWDIDKQQTVLGRFGWKANQPTVVQQTAAAFNGDMGITSELFPAASCTSQQTACQPLPDGGKPEITPAILEKVVFYASMLAVPARRTPQDDTVAQGQKLFTQVGCGQCHIPTFKTGAKAGFPELEYQTIQPFTDLLLHDMGEGLADNRPDFLADGREWRTAPLWGIGLIQTVNGHTRFLHDGRARNLLEAILWHGGEAKAAQQAVLAMNKDERTALLHFLESL